MSGRSITLLKHAANPGLRRLGGALAGAVGSGVKGVGKVLHGAAELGAGAAEHAGVAPALGAGLGVATVGLGAVAGGREVKNRVDNWRLQNGLYATPPVQYY